MQHERKQRNELKIQLSIKDQNLHYMLRVNLILKNFSYGTKAGHIRMQDILHNVSYVGPSGNVIAGLGCPKPKPIN
jgi:hypothetical protein